MRKEYLELGQIVGTHGIKGEIRVNPWCDSPEFATRFKTVFFDERGMEPISVTASRVHGNTVLMQLKNIDSIDEAAALRNKVLYIRRADARLPDGSWFVSELLACRVFDADDKKKQYGTLTDVSETGANDVWHITDQNGKEFLIPSIPDVVVSVDIDQGLIYIRPLKGIFDDAD